MNNAITAIIFLSNILVHWKRDTRNIASEQ